MSNFYPQSYQTIWRNTTLSNPAGLIDIIEGQAGKRIAVYGLMLAVQHSTLASVGTGLAVVQVATNTGATQFGEFFIGQGVPVVLPESPSRQPWLVFPTGLDFELRNSSPSIALRINVLVKFAFVGEREQTWRASDLAN